MYRTDGLLFLREKSMITLYGHEISGNSYIALARDGKIDLDAYPNVLSLIERVKQLPGYIPMTGI
jgi:hypothetical protein